MKKQWIIACLIGIQGVNVQAQQPNKYPYQDTKLTAEQRADDLLQRLTLEEKVALMQNNSPAIPRLGIKPYEWWNEALHGVARAGLATVFPQAIGMAASFNDELLYEVFDAVSDEARAKNRQFNEKGQYKRYQGLTMWTPNVNIFRDPRWGRGQETYGEDPYLSGRMGMAAVRGLQGPEDAEYDKLHACAKHFAVHSGPEWNRHSFNAENIAPRDLWETYLPAFKELVQKAGVKEVMCAYNRFEGDPCCGSNRLLTQILRNEWGFKGIVVTDCGAIGDFIQRTKHGTHPDAAHASADAVLSGTVFSRQEHKPVKFFFGQFLQLFRCAPCKLLYLCFHVGHGGSHCRHRISPCFLSVTTDKVNFFKCELSHAPIPPIPCFWSLPPVFSGRRLRSFCPVQP